MFTFGCLFAGIGAFVSGFRRCGLEPLWANEIDPKACETFEFNHLDCRLIQKDVRKLGVRKDKLKPVDILTAGFPCQSFSQAGARSGFDDFRGELFFEIIRIIKEFKNRRPAVLLLENVPHLQYGCNGRWFNVIRNEIQLAGYWFNDKNAKIIDTAKVTNIPQHRERLFMVAFSTNAFSSNKFNFPEAVAASRPLHKFFDIGKVKDERYYLDKNNKYYTEIMKEVSKGSQKSLYQYRKYFVRRVAEGLCPTLTANMGLGGHNVPFLLDGGRLRKLTERECARLQGFSDNEFDFPEAVVQSHRYAQIGNSVTVPVIELLAREIVSQLKRQRRQN